MRLPGFITFMLAAVTLLHANPLTLKQAARIAIENSPVIRAAEARADAATESYRQSIGYRLPSLDVMEIFARTNNPAEAFAFQLNQERFSMAEFANPANDPNNPDELNTAITRAELSLPVFAGGMLHARMRQAHLMAKASQLDLDRTRNQVLYETSEAFANLAKARESLTLMSKTRETAQAHLTRARNYHEEGLLVSSDVMRAEIFASEAEEWLARARNGAALAQAALNFHLGLPRDTEHSPLDPQSAESEPRSLDWWIETAVEQRPDLSAARHQLKAGQLESAAARSSFLPEIGLKARYDFYDDELFGDNGESWSLMAVAKINLFHGGADRARWAKALHDARAGEHDVVRFEEGVRLAVQQAHGDLESARLRQTTATAALKAGRENLRITEERFAQGVGSMIDLVDAQTALKDTELRELTARYDALLAGYRLAHATGLPVIELEEN